MVTVPQTPATHDPPSLKGRQAVIADFVCEEEPHMFDASESGGYMPVALGSLLNDGEYEVVRKLGWGVSSSVWLARHTRDEFSGPYHVAIKILTVQATMEEANNITEEMIVYKTLMENWKLYPGVMNCQMLLEGFLTESRHGQHWCFITDVYGLTIHDMQNGLSRQRFPLSAVKNIIRQLLVALDVLHRLGIIHTDVKPQNMFIVLPRSTRSGIHWWSQDHPSETYAPRYEPRLSPDPIITIKSQPLPQFGLDSMDTMGVHLGDFGCARFVKDMSPGLIGQPVRLRAPEVVLGEGWSTAVDVWSVGCIIYELLAARPLFNVDEAAPQANGAYLQQIRDKVGSFPSSFLGRCARRERYFDSHDLLRLENMSKAYEARGSLSQDLQEDGSLTEGDLRSTVAFMKRCLEIDPLTRASAAELLTDEWFTGVCDTLRNPIIV